MLVSPFSLRRIQAFLMLPTMDPNDDPRQHPEVVPEGDSIAIKGGDFQWSHGDGAEPEASKAQAQAPAPAPAASAPAPAAGDNGDAGSVTSQAEGDESRGKLSGVDLTVRKGELFVIVGPVGSGKSSLLSAMLGEMPRVAGSVGVVGRVGLVPQQAFILNATLRANVVMDRPWDEERYNRVLDACCLRPDLAMLPAGDATEIGERGLNLSGGQMARVSLARAVYDDADVLLLDDILAAVDAHVGRALLQQVVLGELKSRTRVLVTNQLKVGAVVSGPPRHPVVHMRVSHTAAPVRSWCSTMQTRSCSCLRAALPKRAPTPSCLPGATASSVASCRSLEVQPTMTPLMVRHKTGRLGLPPEPGLALVLVRLRSWLVPGSRTATAQLLPWRASKASRWQRILQQVLQLM